MLVGENSEAEERERDNFETSYYNACTLIKAQLRKLRTNATPTPVVSNTTSNHPKLPDLELPRFSGEYTEWFSFSNSFKDLVHENNDLNQCQKFRYLRSQLSGDALRIVGKLSVSAANYEAAWALLEDRYENKRLIVQEHVNSIINAKIVSKGSFSELRSLIDDLKCPCTLCSSVACDTNAIEQQHIGLNGHVHTVAFLRDAAKCRMRQFFGLQHLQYISNSNEMVNINMSSQFSNFTTSINCLVLNQITHDLPLVSVSRSNFQIPANIQLADEGFNETGTIDLLIGAALFWELLTDKRIHTSKNQPMFIGTKLGWIVGGTTHTKTATIPFRTICNVSTNNNLEARVDQFFQLENYLDNVEPKWTNEQEHCEVHFRETFTRTNDGRFVVRLPKKNNELHLGNSYEIARKRFLNLERKLNRDDSLKRDYDKFMEEYESLNHMTPVSEQEVQNYADVCFLPHHPVFKASSTTTKLRVVFDASAKTNNGLSLNDNLLCGPTIQSDLFSILIRFRCFRYVLGADITKMYRQILVDETDSRLQLILWRNCPTSKIQTYKLRTLTYGTKPASFIATRCLQELSTQHMAKYPSASKAILQNTYMDDIIVGTDNLEDAIDLRSQLKTVLADGGFQLSKWMSNDPRILPNSDDGNPVTLNFDKNYDTKALGLNWNCRDDTLTYSHKIETQTNRITKRVVLATIATIFDPLGLAGPIVVTGKIILRELWSLNLTWDQTIPPNMLSAWKHFLTTLSQISELHIYRSVAPLLDQWDYHELHGFADASMKAYGAAVYVRTKTLAGEYTCRLLCPKSRVAPQRVVSIPRLELCAAQLLARLMQRVSNCSELKFSKRYLWTDSSIVLSWLCQPSATWQTFVANRVSDIHSITDTKEWHHISSENNPADLLSRGASTDKIIGNELWFFGPEFLRHCDRDWPENSFRIIDAPEARKIALVAHGPPASDLITFDRFSKFHRLQRSIAFVLRFIKNCREQERQTGTLTASELQRALFHIMRDVQSTAFRSEITQLRNNKPIPSGSKLSQLSPFLDDQGILRVGGRLKHSNLSFETKHPILLPSDHHVTKLIVTSEHERQLHAGPLATLAAVRERFWVLAGRNVVRKIIHRCMRCFRAKPTVSFQKMGDIPADRLIPSRPFLTTGVDYAGPILIRDGRGRTKRLIKSYIAVFVCFVSNAVHLELVTDLTTESFLNALRRMIARRGHVSKIYSDNATNYVGAKRELDELARFFKTDQFNTIVDNLANQNIKWKFIPPRSPHMGGFWEANVKSVKFHIKRITGNAELNYEELSTLLCRIEACINSRPISSLSSKPDDLSFLTPGHFLIGAPLTTMVEPELTDIKLNRLSRWQLVERLRQQFWKR